MHPQCTLPKRPGIYRIINVRTGACYIGSSINIFVRWQRHKGQLRARTHPNRFLQAVWDAEGVAAFDVSVLEEVSVARLAEVEQAYIAREDPPYNIVGTARGGPGLRKHSAETRAKISAKVRAKPHTPEHTRKLAEHMRRVRAPSTPERARALAKANIGSKRSPETCAKIAASNRRRTLSDATKKKIGDAHQGKPGHGHSAEVRQRISDAKREWWRQRKQE